MLLKMKIVLAMSMALTTFEVLYQPGASADTKTVRLVTVGDSLTEGVGDTTNQQGYTKRTAKLLSKKAQVKVTTGNYGKAGDRSDQIERRLKKNPTAQNNIKKADIITLTVGGNDLQQTLFTAIFSKSPSQVTNKVDQSLPKYEDNLNDLITYILSKNEKAPIFLFGNYNPLYVYLANRNDLNTDVKKYNAINEDIAAQDKRIVYVSTFNTLTFGQFNTPSKKAKLVEDADKASSGSLNNSAVKKTLNGDDKEKNDLITNSDHYHPNDKGYQKMSQLLVQKIMENKRLWRK